jgi:hypothetical protein
MQAARTSRLRQPRSCEMKQKLLLAVACLLCAYLTCRDPYGLSGTEFSGGSVTGRLLDANFVGVFVFVLALLLAFIFPRISAVVALAASVLSLPLYLYFVTPGLFRQIFRGPWKVPLRSYFVADRWALLNTLAILLATVVSVYALRSHRQTHSSGRAVQTGGARAPRV